ncbi:hypothetical protein B0H14DRAFT_3115044 [Mycena olivaceomarginata]|nr:hypothetical protein B0H14DRAFT_3115044 [Mycena olivaceomarginata]
MHLGLTLMRIGGGRVAEIAHRALGLPSTSTLRRNTAMRPLLPSAGRPWVKDIEENIQACLDSCPEEDSPSVVHQVLMLDEIAIERRSRYDDRTNKVVRVCRQHGYKVPLDLETEKDLEVLCEGLKSEKAHLAGEATVAALGVLTSNPRLYAARPILFSADCKKESGPDHAANVLRPLMTAINNKSKRGCTIYKTVSAASDGEGRRALAFVMEYMKCPLAPESPIYPLLSGCELMNFHVGDNDITPDKDTKHALKCLRNLTMRDAGIKVCGFRLTAAIIKVHLRQNNITDRAIHSLLNPRDRQHVSIAFSLLKAIWELPDAIPTSRPLFRRAREVLKIFGRLCYWLLTPYVCVDLDLSEQLTRLSAAAHLLMDLYANDNARKTFMPTQTFVNLMIMIKNVYFCVAKTKVDIPDGKFWLILLGTDRLEIFSVCFDRAPRRIKLPTMGEAGEIISSKFDHLNPVSWKGNVEVRNVVPLTCWIRGRKLVEEFLPDTQDVFKHMARRGVDISPMGFSLVEIYDQEDIDTAYRSSVLEAEYPPSPPMRAPESEPTYPGDDDLEDALGVEDPRGGFDVHMDFNGTRLSKAKALRLAMAGLTGPRASTDRTK